MFGGIKVLVTGCSGFLGPWLCERLVANGANVVGADIQFDASSRIHEVKPITLETVDVERFDQVYDVVRKHGVQFVFHLAAQSLVGVAMRDPMRTVMTNVMGTTNVLETARRLCGGDGAAGAIDVPGASGSPAAMGSSATMGSPAADGALLGVVVASSDKAYGEQSQLPYLEHMPMQGCFPYDASKSCADLLARSYAQSFRLPIAVVRCGNLYGPGDLNWCRIVPGTIRSCLRNERPVIRSDGTLVRDYIYVADAADAFLRIGNGLITGDTEYGEAFNVGTDAPMTVLQLVREIQMVAGTDDVKPIIENRVSTEIKAQYLSSEHLRKKLGWHASTDLQAGLLSAVEWYRTRC